MLMKNKILSKAYGGVTEARRKLYGLGLPRQWKVITSTLLLLFTFAIGNVWAEEVKLVSVGTAATQSSPDFFDNKTYKSADESYSVNLSTNGTSKSQGGGYGSPSVKDYYYAMGGNCDMSSATIANYMKVAATGCKISKIVVRAHCNTTSTACFPAAGFVTGLPETSTIGTKSGRIADVIIDNQTPASYGSVKRFDNASTLTYTFSTNVSEVYFSKQIKKAGLAGATAWSDYPASSAQAACVYGIDVYVVPEGPKESAINYTNLKGADNSANPTKYTEGTGIASFTDLADVTGYSFAGWDPASISASATGEQTINATWTTNTHSLVWNIPGDATITNSETYTHGTVAYGTAIVAPTLTRDGYDFLGWDATPAATMPDNDLEYTATWQPAAAKHDIEYVGYGSADISSYPTQYSEGIGIASFAPLADTEDQHFLGWSPASIPADATTDQTITATWEDKKVVTFNTGLGSAIAAVKVVSGEVVAAPTAPTRLNWTFQKWQKEGTDYDFATPVTEDITLDAVWSRDEISGPSSDIVISSGTTVNTGGTLSVAVSPSLSTSNGGVKFGGNITTGTNNPTRYISFTIPEGYTAAVKTITLHDANNVIIRNDIDGVTLNDHVFYVSNNTAEYNKTLVPGTYYIGRGGSTSYMTYCSLTVSEAPIMVTFKTGEATYTAISATSGEKLGNLFLNGELPSGLVVPGYTFNGWTGVTKETVITASMTVQADLTPVAYNVTLDKGVYGSTDGAATAGLGDAALTISSTATAPAGYTLLGYFTAADGETKVAEADGSFVDATIAGYIAAGKWNNAGDATLYAHWQDNSAVAKIGTTNYATFAEAIEAVAAGQTIQLLADCSYDAAWNLTLAGTVTLDLNGHELTYNGAGRGVQVHNGAKLVLEDGTATVVPTIDLTADPLSRSAITYTSGTFDSKDGMCATAGGEIEINSGTYLATEGVVLVVGNAATVTVNDGVLISRDNGVLMGNGTNSDSYRNYVINVHGGILLGEIFSPGYASMVIYHPNVGELNIDGGTLVSTNGPAVVCRGGESNITGGTIVAQGSGSGKCGDASLVLPAVGVAYDFKSAYPGVSSFDAKISGDANVSGEAGAVKGIYVGATPTPAEKDAVAISGGTFNSPVAQALCAENYAPNSWTDGTGTHYGVKPLAVTFDIEAYVVGDNTVDLDDVKEQLTAKGYAYSNISGVDRGHTHNYIYDGIKWSNANDGYIQFETAAKKLVIVKTGRMQSDASAKMSVNGVESATVIESADESKETHKLYYWYNADAALYKLDIKSKTAGGTCVLKAITITDPYEVSYNTHGGDPIAAQYFYGTAITLPTPTYGTQSFKGWYDAETGGNLIGAAGASYTPTGNIELHAQWETVSTVNTLSDLQVDGATIDGFDPATDIYYLVYEYGQQPVITSATATAGALATVTINNTPVDEGTYKYVQVKVVPESGEEDQKFYQVRYTNKLKRGVEIIKVETTGGNNKTVSGLYAGDGDVNLSTGGNARKMDEGKYIGFILDGTALEAGDIVNVHTSAAATTGGSHIIFYDNMTDKTELYETGEIGGTGDNLFVINAAMEGSTTAYVYRSNADNAHKWNGFVDYLSVERYMAPFIEEFKIGEAIGTIDKVNKTIAVEIPATADLEHLTPTIKAYANGGATLDKTGEQDFSAGAVNYTVSSAYAEDGDVTYAVTVTKAAAIKEVIISGTLSVLEGETTTLSAAVYDTNDELASIQAVVWTVKSGDESLAEVSATGVVTGKAVGTAHIIATSVADDTKSAEVEVAISVNPCRVWSNPSTRTETITLGNLKVKPINIEELKSLTPYAGAEAANSWKLNARDDKYAELYFSDGAQFDALTIGVTSNQAASETEYKYAVVFSTASGDGFDAGIIETQVFNAGYKDAAEALADVVLPEHTRAVRIMRQHREGGSDLGGGSSVYLYYIRACKKELVPLTSVSLADMSLAVGVTGTPEITLNPAGADIASYAWSIISDETGVATIDAATGALSSAATGAVTVKVTATDVLSNVRESNVATINIVNKYVDVVPVNETTTWSWSGLATADVKVTDVDTVLANYFGGAEWQKIAGKAGNDQYAYRSGSSYDCYQGTYLYLKATVPGMLIIKACYASSGAKLSVNGHEIATLTDQYTEYKVAVPAGNVKIEATGNQKMRIKTMKFDTDFSNYAVTANRFNGYTRDVTEGRYGTICLPNGGIMVGATLYEVAYYGATSEKIFFDEILNGTMVAGVPYIFLPKEGASQLAVYYTDEANAPQGNHNGLHGFIGANADAEMDVPVGAYILNANQYRQVVTLGSAKIKSNRSYIELGEITPSEPALAPGRRRISMSVYSEQVATGIENTGFESEAPRKVLINGELFIIRGEKMYDAKGQLVK